MTAPFWAIHSIKGKENVDSLVGELRKGRVDVSGMSTEELSKHMETEAGIRRRIRAAQGLEDVLPTPSVVNDELNAMAGRPNIKGERQPADATQVRIYGK